MASGKLTRTNHLYLVWVRENYPKLSSAVDFIIRNLEKELETQQFYSEENENIRNYITKRNFQEKGDKRDRWSSLQMQKWGTRF